MTPEPVAEPCPVWPVAGSVEVMPSATIVTTAGLTALTMSTIEFVPPASEPVLATLPTGVAAGAGAVPVAALTARYVPPEARRAEARTALRTKPGPTERRWPATEGAGAGASSVPG